MNKPKTSKSSGGNPLMLLFIVLCLGAAVWVLRGGMQKYPDPPTSLINDSIPLTVESAAKDGWIPCPGECLKLSMPGWHHQPVEGHSPSDIWMSYPCAVGVASYNQQHIGHIIRAYSEKPAEDTGLCPICHGTGWVRKDAKSKG